MNTQHISVYSQVALLASATIAMALTANSLTKTLFVVHWLVWRFGRSKPSGVRAVGVTIAVALAMTVMATASNTCAPERDSSASSSWW